jgi:signal transduction histidine kinase
MSPKTILVVEDEVIIAMDIQRNLTKLGYQVPHIVVSGEQAIKTAIEIKPDLILMDIMLKGKIDGITAAQKIRDEFFLPIVFLTAHTDLKTLERSKQIQPFGYIVKPFEERELYTTIEIALARYQAEIEVRRALATEKELNELKSRFVSMVSHEFRTPLSTILLSASLLENHSQNWDEDKHKRHFQRIQIAVQQMNHLLENVLILGKAEANRLDYQPTGLDLKFFCEELIEETKFEATDLHRVELDFQIQDNVVEADSSLLRHILSNLLSNAVKYSPDGGCIDFAVKQVDEKIIFEVKDEGIGISPEDQKQLFEAFYRGRNTGTISGTGLGMSIVKKAVDFYQGKIECESLLGKGTKFSVSLPLKTQSLA